MQDYTRSYMLYKKQVKITQAIKKCATYVGYTVLLAIMLFVAVGGILLISPEL